MKRVGRRQRSLRRGPNSFLRRVTQFITRRVPLVRLVATAVLAASGGAVAAAQPKAGAVLIGALLLLVVGVALGTARGIAALSSILIACTFVTRFKFAVAGVHLRLEDIAVIPLMCSLLAHLWRTNREEPPLSRRRGRLALCARHPASVFLLAYVIWSALISVLASPSVTASLRISAWLLLDWAIMISLTAALPSRQAMEDVGWRWAMVAMLIADVLYVIGPQIGFGVQTASATLAGSKSAYGLSYEANILGSTAALWLFIRLSGQGRTREPAGSYRATNIVTWFGVCAVAMALIVSLTRAAVAAFFAGVAVLAIADVSHIRTRLIRRLSYVLIGAVLLLVLVPSIGGPVETKLANLTNLSRGSSVERIDTAELALADLNGFHWVLGLGMNSFGQRHYSPLQTSQEVTGYIGIFPLEVLYDTGVVGIILILGAWLSLRPWRSPHRGRALGLSAVFLVCSVATSPFWLGSSWFLIGLGIASDLTRRQPRESS